ncbi:MAG TPA: fibronectin type III domain-containing protein [Thermoanaerobaculia bacterium]|nr:fibronectin type III domain-containing protein [Thermoanaerobaculia bacterium]
MRRPILSFLTATGWLFFTAAGFAQVHPNLEKGFSPDKMYEFHDIDHINLFNGNLSLTIPMGGSTPVSDRLSMSMTLVYNSKLWDTWTKPNPDTQFPEPQTLKTPSGRSNAGLGWMLSFGRMLQGRTSVDDPNDSDIVNDGEIHYESPDGSDRIFWGSIHNNSGETSDTAYAYTRDGSYIRLTGPANTNTRLIETADGMVREFSSYMDGDRRRWRVTKISDPFGNHLDFDYSTALQWTITDQYARQTIVHFKDILAGDSMVYTGNPAYLTAVDYIDVPKTGSGTARYSFVYTNMWVRTGYCGWDDAYKYSDTNHYRVPTLTSVTLPDGSSYQFSYTVGASATITVPDDPGDCSGGSLTSAQLPTQGSISWQYQLYFLPVDGCDTDTLSCSAGIASRKLHDPLSSNDGTWSYTQALTPETQAAWRCSPHEILYDYAPSEESITTVIDPALNKTVSHFTVWPVWRFLGNLPPDGSNPDGTRPDGASYSEYGLPFTHKTVAAGSDKLISTETYQGSSVKRQTYVKYEMDPRVGLSYDMNRRLVGSRTVFNDDSNNYIDVDSSDFDGVGHYRTTTTTGSFSGSLARTVTTDYNKPSAAVGSGIFSTGSYPGSFVRPTGAHWLLNLYDRSTTLENSISAVQDLCFDPTSGFLNGTRTYASASTAQTIDLMAAFASDSAAANGVLGAVTSEKYYGGDLHPLTTAASTLCGALASAGASDPGTLGYEMHHTYDHGVRRTSQYYSAGSSVGFLFLDQTIDAPTGLVSASRDTAGVETDYTYDDSRRVKSAITANDAQISYDYVNATGTTGATVTISQASGAGSGTPKAAFAFDGFGRLVLHSSTLPSTTPGSTRWARQSTVFDSLGRKSKVSEFEESDTPSHFTEFSDFDAFGRALTVKKPDGKFSYVEYAGSREVHRTAYIHTQAGDDTAAMTKEFYDIHGRLTEVIEPDSNLDAKYTYDVGNRLHTASIAGDGIAQTRTFNYDNRGFLGSEFHPELGSGGTTYDTYDARGHAHHKLTGAQNGIYDLQLTYDASERLVDVSDQNGARELKHFVFATENDMTPIPPDYPNYKKGKLVQAVRTNHLPAGDVVVTETYNYQTASGRVFSRKTDVTSGTNTLQSFVQNPVYDDLGEIITPGYPTCVDPFPCAATPSAGTTYTYKDGSLSTIPGYAKSISYLGNMLSQVVHQNDVTDTYSQDATNGLPRPSSIAFANWSSSCPTPAAPVITAATSVTSNSTGNVATVPADGTLQYNWSITGGTITSSTTTSSITYTAGASGTVVLSVTASFVSNTCGQGPAGTRNVPILQQLSPPVNFSATTQDSNSSVVVLVWSQGLSGPTSYRIERKDCFSCSWTAIGPNPTSATSYTDNSIISIPGNMPRAYLYHVIAVAGGSTDSAPSTLDWAVTASTLFAENIVRGTRIRGTHVQELRKAIDALRSMANLPAYTAGWTDYNAPTGRILAIHQTDMRTALDQAVFSLLNSHITFTGTTPAHGVSILAYHINQLRNAVK